MSRLPLPRAHGRQPRSAGGLGPRRPAAGASSRCVSWSVNIRPLPSTARSPSMRPRDPRIVELLNDALTFELTVTNTYFLHARMLDNWGLPRLGKVFYDLSIDEMRDA